MAVPVLTAAGFGKTIIALKENPNILFWEINAKNNADLEKITGAVIDLDPYRRPMALSAASGFTPSPAIVKRIAIFAVPPGNNAAATCASPSRTGARAFYLYPWSPDPATMSQVWETCTEKEHADGAILASFPFSSAPAAAAISWTFRDIEQDYFTSEAGLPVLAIRSKAEYSIRNLQVYSLSKDKKRLIASQTELAPGRNFFITNGAADLDNIAAAYTTHGGLPRMLPFNVASPTIAPDRFRFSSSGIRLRAGGAVTAELIFTNKASSDARVTVNLTAFSPDITFSPASRNVFVRAGDSVRIPFDIILKKKLRAAGAIKAVATYKNNTSMPLAASLPVTAK